MLTRLMVIDYLFTILHLLIIAFNLFGWIFKNTRKLHFWFAMLTLASWTFLGIWFGLGYCPITDWQWIVKAQLGEHNLPNSFIKYIVDQLTGLNSNESFIDYFTAGFFLISILCTIKVNFYHSKIKSQ